jgi:RPA family protein
MSQQQDTDDSDTDGSDTAPSREIAHRVFAREFNDATHTFRESDDDRAPVYVLLPTGAKANRVFLVGTLTETEDVGSDDEYWQGRIVDPTGTFYVYAGQYQPEAAAVLRETEPPAFVALVGKPRTYETDNGSINVSVRPEELMLVDSATRDRWVTDAADQTLTRIDRFADGSNEYARMARQQYGESVEPYRQAVIEALESLDDVDESRDTQSGTGDPAATTTAADTAGTDTTSSGSSSDSTGAETTSTDTETTTSPDDPGEFDAGGVDSDSE